MNILRTILKCQNYKRKATLKYNDDDNMKL